MSVAKSQRWDGTSAYCLITALMRPQVKSEHAKEPPEEAASQESINHLLPFTFSAINPKLCRCVFFKKHNRAVLTVART